MNIRAQESEVVEDQPGKRVKRFPPNKIHSLPQEELSKNMA